MRQILTAKVKEEIKNRVKLEKSGKVIGLTISGSDLYGFPSEDSDVDYRGVYITSTDALLGSLSRRPFSIYENFKLVYDENDIVLQGFQHTIGLLISGNCNTFEHIFAPQIEQTEEFTELRDIATSLIAKDGLYTSYKGFAKSNMPNAKFPETNTVKRYLYVIKGLLSGIHVLETGKIEPNLQKLNSDRETGEIVDNLIALKMAGGEKAELTKEISESSILAHIELLFEDLNIAYENCPLPEKPSPETLDKVSHWLVKIRRNN